MDASNSGTRQFNGNGKDKCFFLAGALKIRRRIQQEAYLANSKECLEHFQKLFIPPLIHDSTSLVYTGAGGGAKIMINSKTVYFTVHLETSVETFAFKW